MTVRQNSNVVVKLQKAQLEEHSATRILHNATALSRKPRCSHSQTTREPSPAPPPPESRKGARQAGAVCCAGGGGDDASLLAEVTRQPEWLGGVLERLWGCGGIEDGEVKGGQQGG